MLDVETNDNIDIEKMWKSRDISNHCQVARFASGQNMLVNDGCIEAFGRLNSS